VRNVHKGQPILASPPRPFKAHHQVHLGLYSDDWD
jgi:hypothetical protein